MITLKEAYEIVNKNKTKDNEKIIEFLENSKIKNVKKLMKKINDPYFFRYIKELSTKIYCLCEMDIDNADDILFDLLKDKNKQTVWNYFNIIEKFGDKVSFINKFDDRRKLEFLEYFSLEDIEKILSTIKDDSIIEEVIKMYDKYLEFNFEDALPNIVKCMNTDEYKNKYISVLYGENKKNVILSLKDDRLKVKHLNSNLDGEEKAEIIVTIKDMDLFILAIKQLDKFYDKYIVLKLCENTKLYDIAKNVIEDCKYTITKSGKKILSKDYVKSLNPAGIKMKTRNEIIDFLMNNDDDDNFDIVRILKDPSLFEYIKDFVYRLNLIETMEIKDDIKAEFIANELMKLKSDEEKIEYIEPLSFYPNLFVRVIATFNDDKKKIRYINISEEQEDLLILFNSMKSNEMKMEVINNCLGETKYLLISKLENDEDKIKYLSIPADGSIEKIVIASLKDDNLKMQYINDEKYKDYALYIIKSLRNESLIAMCLLNYNKTSQDEIIENTKNPFTKKMLKLYKKRVGEKC